MKNTQSKVKNQTEPLGKMIINGREASFFPGESILEIARREGIDIPSFCYHSELSVYGACRLCLVEVEGRGLAASCSTLPENGLVVTTESSRLRNMRRTLLNLLLANHKIDCPACSKGSSCRLQELCQRLGILNIPMVTERELVPLDGSSISLIRDPNKCILCGDCVRICREIQGIGALDFAYRGPKTMVVPAFGRPLAEGDCVNCGQCAAVCPTAAITIRSERDEVFAALEDPDMIVVAQIAPAVRVAIGEEFGLPPGEDGTGLVIAALRRVGFDLVYDTVFAADLTTVEETHEFQERLKRGGPFPHLTSCCPAWVKYCEQYASDFLPNLSTCKSPQQMLGAIIKEVDAAKRGIDKTRVRVVSIMPCTAKKFEARRPEHNDSVDWVLSTVETSQLIREAGIIFANLQPELADEPLGMYTGAGVIFGASGGVAESVVREALEQAGLPQPESLTFASVEDAEGRVSEASLTLGSSTLRMAVVSGLGAAGALLKDIRDGRRHYDVIEVMACPGGCVGGGGQPVAEPSARGWREDGLDRIDRAAALRVASHNACVNALYSEYFETPGSGKAHHLLHTHYASRQRMPGSSSHLILAAEEGALEVSVCVGTSCYLRGSHGVLENLLDALRKEGLEKVVKLTATFCLEHCDRGVSVRVGEEVITGVKPDMVEQIMEEQIHPRLTAWRGVK